MTSKPAGVHAAVATRGIELIAAPSNLGLRPPAPGREPGAWRAPAALRSAGLASRLEAERVVELPRPPYEFELQPGTRIRNGVTIRAHALALADAVRTALAASRFPVVLGGDCSILLGCLVGARGAGRCGLVHVDGHSDFRHPGNHDAGSRPGTAAGMDLALATGRGELLLTHWPGLGGPLVADEDVVQVGDRDAEARVGPPSEGALDAPIERITAQQVLRFGVAQACARVTTRLAKRSLERVWLHVDVDVLDPRVMPAVDSPGSPGLDFARLADLLAGIVATGRVVGLDLTIYDPERDPGGVYAPRIADCLVAGLGPLHARAASIPRAEDRHA